MTGFRNLSCILLFSLASSSRLFALGPELLSPTEGAEDVPTDTELSWRAGVQVDLMANGSFESGTTGWIHNTAGISAFESMASADAAAGARFGRLMMRTPRNFADIFIFQSVTIPTYPSTAVLRWKDQTTGGGNLQGSYNVVATATQPGRSVLYSSTVGLNDTFELWNEHEADLTEYRGKLTVIEFGMTNRFAEPMRLLLDDVRLEVTPTAPSFEVFLGISPTLTAAQRIFQGTDLSKVVTGLAPGTRHYWRVDQLVSGRRVSSPVISFLTAGSLPPVAPALTEVSVEGDLFRFRLATDAGRTYRVERSTDFALEAWVAEGDPITGTGDLVTVEASVLPAESACFRVLVE